MNKHRIFALLLAAMLTASAMTGCGGSTAETNADTIETAAAETIPAETEAPEPTYDFEGADYRMLNFDQLWTMFTPTDAAEMTGDVMNDAIYLRNRKVEQDLNFRYVECPLVCTNNDPAQLTTHARTSLLAGDDAYDIMHLSIMYSTGLITEGLLADLNKTPEFRFQEDWWDRLINENITFKDQLYFASGAANLLTYESMWVLYFNENMVTDLGLSQPYDLAREGKWTLDKMIEYADAATNLQGDDTFAWNKSGSCVYGLGNHAHSAEHFWVSAGVYTFDLSADEPVFTMQGDHFYSVMEKLAALLNPADGGSIRQHDDLQDIFGGSRSLFCTWEVAAAQEFREFEFTFGILPFPKYDEAQEDYLTTVMMQVFGMAIPAASPNISRTAVITDAVAKASLEMVIPEYYGKVVEHKGLRNENSIEMLDICRRTRTVDAATIMNWDTDLRTAIKDKLYAGDGAVSSVVAKYQTATENKAQEYFDYLAE